MHEPQISAVRAALRSLDSGAAWPAGRSPEPDEIYTPSRHRNVLDINRTIVVGNRGVGKTFWSHALLSKAGRDRLASQYDLSSLRDVTAEFGFKGSFSDRFAPSEVVLSAALEKVGDPLTVWKAVLLRILQVPQLASMSEDLVKLSEWLKVNPEEGERLLRIADSSRTKPLLVMFDALDTLASDWTQIRNRTEGLLKLAVLAKGFKYVKLKIFRRPDQFEDTAVFRFPDASKLRAERVGLQWRGTDLYGLMLFHLLRDDDARPCVKQIMTSLFSSLVSSDGNVQEQYLNLEDVQRPIFNAFAGEWMGRDRKRGATYSWLIQHLADANGETTPRGFLTALKSAAETASPELPQAIDFRGLHHGVAVASENRVDDLRQDYWWIDFVRAGLSGMETPLDRETLFGKWSENGVVNLIKTASAGRGILPLHLALRDFLDRLPPDMARLLDSDEAALLQTLRLIGVAEIRSNGKVNFPDIFRVAFGMKRRGGVAPRPQG